MNLDRLAAKINSVGIEINVGQLEKITGEERLKQFYTQIVERLIGKYKQYTGHNLRFISYESLVIKVLFRCFMRVSSKSRQCTVN